MKFRSPGLLVDGAPRDLLAACSDSAETPSPPPSGADDDGPGRTSVSSRSPCRRAPDGPLHGLRPRAEGDEAFAPTITGDSLSWATTSRRST